MTAQTATARREALPAPGVAGERQSVREAASGYARATPGELVAALQDGDDLAWSELLRRYSDRVANKVRSFRLNTADADDAVQNTWIRLMDNVAGINDPECLGGWLATTAARECIQLLNRGKREVLTADTELLDRVEEHSAEHVVVQNGFSDWLWGLVDQMPVRQRMLLRTLCAASLGSYADVVAITGMPVGSIGPTRRRTLAHLREIMADNGITESDWNGH